MFFVSRYLGIIELIKGIGDSLVNFFKEIIEFIQFIVLSISQVLAILLNSMIYLSSLQQEMPGFLFIFFGLYSITIVVRIIMQLI